MMAKTLGMLFAETAIAGDRTGGGTVGTLNHLLAKAAGFKPHSDLVDTGIGSALLRYKIDVTTQRERTGYPAVGTSVDSHHGSIAQIQQADDERTVGIVERQVILTQQHTPRHRITLNARSAHI